MAVWVAVTVTVPVKVCVVVDVTVPVGMFKQLQAEEMAAVFV